MCCTQRIRLRTPSALLDVLFRTSLLYYDLFVLVQHLLAVIKVAYVMLKCFMYASLFNIIIRPFHLRRAIARTHASTHLNLLVHSTPGM